MAFPTGDLPTTGPSKIISGSYTATFSPSAEGTGLHCATEEETCKRCGLETKAEDMRGDICKYH